MSIDGIVETFQRLLSPLLPLEGIRKRSLTEIKSGEDIRLLWRRGDFEVTFSFEHDGAVKRLSWQSTDIVGEDSVSLYHLTAETEGEVWRITRCDVPETTFLRSASSSPSDIAFQYFGDLLCNSGPWEVYPYRERGASAG